MVKDYNEEKIFSKCMSEQGFEPMHVEFDCLLTPHLTTELRVIVKIDVFMNDTTYKRNYLTIS